MAECFGRFPKQRGVLGRGQLQHSQAPVHHITGMNHLCRKVRSPRNIFGDLVRVQKSSRHMLVKIENYDATPLLNTTLEGVRYALLAQNPLPVTNLTIDKIFRILQLEFKNVPPYHNINIRETTQKRPRTPD